MACINLKSMASLAVAATLTVASASSQAVTLLSEGFESVASLSTAGWSLLNLSSPAGSTDWFQGNGDPVTGPFAAQAGTMNSYIAANYNGATVGGTLNELLISPLFSTAAAGSVTFWARAEIVSPYSDTIRFGINGSSGTPVAFTTAVLTGTWTQYTVNFAAAGAGATGRFTVNYVGAADTSNYIGIDTLTVTAVPEPASALLLAGGLFAIGVARRARSTR